MSSGKARISVRVEGIVQGVGFRPHVHALARRLRLAGWVGNDGGGVFIEAEGSPEDLARFQTDLCEQAPPLAAIHRMTATPIPARGERGFRIAGSPQGSAPATLVSPDAATCGDCLAELFDPADRRFLHPFINCTNCGPRFTVVKDVPYDRPATTMAGFAMCGECEREYLDPEDRRFHAQPICCPDCGPTLRLLEAGGRSLPGDPIEEAAGLLRSGRVLAVKGLGGYHLAVGAADEDAVRTLRTRKHREEKPFAVVVPDLDAARGLCELDSEAEALLAGPRSPIVLLPRRPGAAVAEGVAPGHRRLGLMLPYTPVHHLLARAFAGPYVLTSGNLSDEPIAHQDGDALDRLGGLADGFLVHDRPIHVRGDDSVILPGRGRSIVVRRSRGYAPQPVMLSDPAPRHVLACGAELKHTFCVVRERQAFVSQHIGDLENYETMWSFIEGVEHFRRLFGITPRLVAHDLHPEYLSTKYALDTEGADLVAVQHHHAHIASCLADNQERGPVIGVAFDGLGYGDDDTLWGGELLVADLVDFTRTGRLSPVPLPGGTAAIRQPWRMAAAHLDSAYGGAPPQDLQVRSRNQGRWADVTALARSGTNAPLASSAGRLFDAVASILGLGDTAAYEGQAAIALEQSADPAEHAAYPAGLLDGDLVTIDSGDLVRAVVEDVRAGVSPAIISARFHHGLAAATADGCVRLRAATGLSTVALSGGVFQNQLFLAALAGRLESRGFRVLTHRRIPPNDGGISLGQAVVAAARDAADRC
ncbi:carbamoyltransferase HypF [Nonomuraea sediminis]|uniref:carbamoyltransferase HypF n=1 Tax=Nonomuraea sediminis TaxID=2835864 RepID=UPI001BDC03F4|nr:carbamoyltransferase HypF [Nonomuraea sediminis]